MLTKKQKEVLDYFQDYYREHGILPSLREAAEDLGMKSHSAVHRYLDVLDDKGFIKKGEYHTKRNFEIIAPGDDLLFAGTVAAGEPLEVVEEGTETIEVPKRFVDSRKKRYVLEVEGDSMQDMGLLSGDYVVVESREEADNGEVVVAMLNGGATLKELKKNKTGVELIPKNEKYKPIKVGGDDDFSVIGVLIGSFRQYQV